MTSYNKVSQGQGVTNSRNWLRKFDRLRGNRMISFWGHVMDQALSVLGDGRRFFYLLLALMGLSFWAYTWADGEFVRKQDFDQLNKLMTEHVDDMQIVTASQFIRDKQLQLQLAHATSQPPEQIQGIENEIAKAEKYLDCLLQDGTNCKHLKPREY